MKKLIKYCVVILIFVSVLEIGVRLTGIAKTNTEKRGDGYASYYNQTIDSWLHLWPPNQEIPFNQTEFNYIYKSNSLGLIEKEFTQQKDSNTYRLLCIGDSFTQGDGAPQEKSFPRYLEKLLNKQQDSIQYEVINAGVCGSDVFYMHQLIKQKLINYNFDGIIFLLGTSDIEDIIYRGGNERFNQDGSTVLKEGPWYENLYKHSHFFRVILHSFGMNKMLLFPKKSKEKYLEANTLFKNEIIEMNKELTKYPHLNSVMFAFLGPHEIDKYTYKEVEHLIQLNNEEKLQIHPRSLAVNIAKNPQVIPIFKESYQIFKPLDFTDYAWPINSHFNAYGYEKLAEIIYNKTLEEDSLFFKFK